MRNKQAKWLRRLCRELNIHSYRRVKKLFTKTPTDRKARFENLVRRAVVVQQILSQPNKGQHAKSN